MNTFKRNLSIVLAVALLFTSMNYTGFGNWLDRVLQEGPAISYAAPATPSFKKATASDAVLPEYYTRKSTCSAYFKTRTGTDEYRVYGIGESGEGWYPADSGYEPVTGGSVVKVSAEYSSIAPVKYVVKAQKEYTSAMWQEFYNAYPQFANTGMTALKKEYSVSWDENYNAGYRTKDKDNVYQVKGAWKLVHTGETAAIKYIAYGKTDNDASHAKNGWISFDEGCGWRYTATFSGVQDAARVPYGGTLYGAVEKKQGGTVINAPDVKGYTTPSGQKVKADGETLSFTYTEHTCKLLNYSYDTDADVETTLHYDGSAASVSAQSAHDGYTLDCYTFAVN